MKILLSSITLFLSLFLHTQLSALPITTFSAQATTLEKQLSRGRWSLVVFWSYNCVVCLAETPALSKLHNKHKNKNLNVIGVSVDGLKNRQKARQFIVRSRMTFPSFLAELPLAADGYLHLSGEPFRGTPSFLLFNPKGELMGAQAGALKTEAVEAFIQNNS